MNIVLRKIQHRGAYRIAVIFPFDFKVKEKLKSLGAVYSATYRCWYFDYSKEKYNLIRKNFENLTIENPGQTEPATTVAGRESHDLPPIVSNKNGEQSAPNKAKFPEKAPERPDQGHKAEQIPLARKLRVQLSGNIGKYWIFRMDYQPATVRALLGIKGIYRNKSQKVYMATRNRVVLPHGCYLLPAAPDVYKAMTVHYEPEKVIIDNQLPEGYLQKGKMPNQKQFLLQNARQQVLEKVPDSARGHVVDMMDAMLANNLSDSTIRNYGNAFCRFLNDNDYQDPASLTYKQIVKYVGSLMEKGLSATTGHMLVNALNYYYRHVENNRNFEFKLPRPKKEHKLRVVFTPEECAAIFTAIDNPKHKLALMIAYGAGLRVKDVVTIKWGHITAPEVC